MTVAQRCVCDFYHHTLWTVDGKLLLFHASHTIFPLEEAGMFYGSECGNGFYTFLNPVACAYHRGFLVRTHTMVLALDAERLLGGFKDDNARHDTTFHVTDRSEKLDIIFSKGSSPFVRWYGGQVVFRTKESLDYLTLLETVDTREMLNFKQFMGTREYYLGRLCES